MNGENNAVVHRRQTRSNAGGDATDSLDDLLARRVSVCVAGRGELKRETHPHVSGMNGRRTRIADVSLDVERPFVPRVLDAGVYFALLEVAVCSGRKLSMGKRESK